MTRKDKLVERAARFSDRMQRKSNITTPQPDTWDNAHDGFIGGYKAAMQDARKIRAESAAPGIRDDALFDYAVAMREWLKPLR